MPTQRSGVGIRLQRQFGGSVWVDNIRALNAQSLGVGQYSDTLQSVEKLDRKRRVGLMKPSVCGTTLVPVVDGTELSNRALDFDGSRIEQDLESSYLK